MPGAHISTSAARVRGLTLAAVLGAAPLAHAEPPVGVEAMRALALELLRAADYERSIEAYRLVLAHTPDDPVSHYDLASALAFLGRFVEAEPPARTAARLLDSDPRAQELAALVLLNLGRYADAFEATRRGAELGDVTAMFALVPLYQRGLGTAADEAAALGWAERAAAAGHLGAIAMLERVGREGGYGRPPDPAAASRWAARLREAEAALDRSAAPEPR